MRNMNVNIIEKPKKNIKYEIKVRNPEDVMTIEDVHAIRNAMREHLLFLGLDRRNNLRNVSLLGIGSSCDLLIDSKEIVRMALFSASDKVILVHNHPSNSLEPSSSDLHLTNSTKNILNVFNVELVDHIIVSEYGYLSMEKQKNLGENYVEDALENMTKGLLIEENDRLKNEISELKEQLKVKEYLIAEQNDELEM